jgi:hypothetical protein
MRGRKPLFRQRRRIHEYHAPSGPQANKRAKKKKSRDKGRRQRHRARRSRAGVGAGGGARKEGVARRRLKGGRGGERGERRTREEKNTTTSGAVASEKRIILSARRLPFGGDMPWVDRPPPCYRSGASCPSDPCARRIVSRWRCESGGGGAVSFAQCAARKRARRIRTLRLPRGYTSQVKSCSSMWLWRGTAGTMRRLGGRGGRMRAATATATATAAAENTSCGGACRTCRTWVGAAGSARRRVGAAMVAAEGIVV